MDDQHWQNIIIKSYNEHLVVVSSENRLLLKENHKFKGLNNSYFSRDRKNEKRKLHTEQI
jgi:hypothetical protein